MQNFMRSLKPEQIMSHTKVESSSSLLEPSFNTQIKNQQSWLLYKPPSNSVTEIASIKVDPKIEKEQE
jgi:hypothetical protein